MGEPCPAPLRVAMRSPLPFPCVPDRPSKILLVQVGTLSFSHPLFGVSVLFIKVTQPGNVGEPATEHGCSVVTVNTSNTVQLPTLNSSNHTPLLKIPVWWRRAVAAPIPPLG